jgi:GntR family transcriptional regulator/MocR family aminotransferase
VSGVDLHLDLSGRRVRDSLETVLRGAVRAGRLRPGTRLPSSRDLAADLGIARNTVAEVYSQLVAEGWLTARTGAGTSVAPRRASRPGAAAAVPPQPPVLRYDLRPGVPDLSAFPRRAWLATARKVLAAAPDHLLGYPDRRGLPPLRAALAEYLARARGVIADPEHVVVCAGFAHGLAVVSRALRTAGARTLAVEAYGHQAHRELAAAQGLRLRPLRVDGMGAVVGEADGADALLLSPAHQFPLGVTLHPRRRREAAARGGVVIEDDYDGEFRYDRQPVGALQALAPDRVVYAGTASKSLAPGLRLGWLVVPPRLLGPVTAQLSAGPSALDQLTMAEFITSGAYDRQIRRARLAYRRRRDRLAAALRRQGLQATGIAAGLHALVELPGTAAERDVLARASRHGVAVDGLQQYRAGGHGVAVDGLQQYRAGGEAAGHDGIAGERAGLVIGYGRPPEHAFTTALARLCAVLGGLSAQRRGRLQRRGVQEGDDRGGQGGGGEDVVVRKPRQDRQPGHRPGRAVPVRVVQPAAEQPEELHDVRRAHRVGVGVDQHHRRGDLPDLPGPVVITPQQVAYLVQQHGPVLDPGGDPGVRLVQRGLLQRLGQLRAHRLHPGQALRVPAVPPAGLGDEHQPADEVRVLDRGAQRGPGA